jgi:16S rRNA (cytosine967-C5)-methyltransferase
VLRRVSRVPTEGSPNEPAVASSEAGTAVRLAEHYSHPPWLVERWLERFGPEETEQLLRWNDSKPRLVLQPARGDSETLLERWRSAGIDVEPAPYGAGLVTDRRRPQELPGFDEGAFVVQDPAQALVAWFADLPPGSVLYDASAAPGGKTITMGREAGRVIAGDVSRTRVQRLVANLARAGRGNEHLVVADAAQPPVRPVPAVLLDAPCLGTGTIARHPDARGRVSPEALARLQRRQAALLEGVAGSVAPGGLLIYATCSLEPEENERQIDAFLARHREFRRDPSDTFPPALLSPVGDLMILPQRHHMDGAFAARLRRR